MFLLISIFKYFFVREAIFFLEFTFTAFLLVLFVHRCLIEIPNRPPRVPRKNLNSRGILGIFFASPRLLRVPRKNFHARGVSDFCLFTRQTHGSHFQQTRRSGQPTLMSILGSGVVVPQLHNRFDHMAKSRCQKETRTLPPYAQWRIPGGGGSCQMGVARRVQRGGGGWSGSEPAPPSRSEVGGRSVARPYPNLPAAVVFDAAHNPDALRRLFQRLKQVRPDSHRTTGSQSDRSTRVRI